MILEMNCYRDVNGKHRFRVFAANHKILARSTRGFETAAELAARVDLILRQDYDAQMYQDRRDEWRWRFEAAIDGAQEIIVVSSEGYKNLGDCKRASDLVLDADRASTV